MKLFIYEHITSGAYIDQPLPEKLLQEGAGMLISILNDSLEIDSIDISIISDYRLSQSDYFKSFDMRKITHLKCNSISEYQNNWKQSLLTCDLVLIIAPETAGVLQQLHEQASNLNTPTLGCSSEAICLTSNKLLCNQILEKHAISFPMTSLAQDWNLTAFDSSDGYIAKPIDGAGCIDTHYLATQKDVEKYIGQLHCEQSGITMIQQYLSGEQISLTVLLTDTYCELLAINQQLINNIDNRLSLVELKINAFWNSTQLSTSKLTTLIQQLKSAIPGLKGLIGIDIVVNDDEINIIDINPRITTSYVGLSTSLAINPLQRLLTAEGHLNQPLDVINQHNTVSISL